MTQPNATAAVPRSLPSQALGVLCVLASGSRGNCSVLVVPEGGTRRIILIDAGLSPRRTFALLRERHIDPWEVDAILFTHLDSDHAHLGWSKVSRLRAPFYIHSSHRGRAERMGLCSRATEVFRESFTIGSGIRVDPELLAHDSLGVVAFRFDITSDEPNRSARVGFATDVGRPTAELIDHLRDSDVLALESNYCPALQRASNRPAFLKQRIMGGSGHLSNDQCVEVVHRIAPRRSLVCLHLSQQCNRPDIVRSLHASAAYDLTIADQFRPTPWIDIQPRSTPLAPIVKTARPQLALWATGGTT
ncbi:MAG: MBL fold metallo-hydrolase [Phycisphaeraceae bacterium]|nr:MBL fold metallo-hydrolase [Phycisphaeraceae bacterium]MCW5763403.1 MBL fold metallo-hydrolase [Phycisphaeraceae bacterium]